MGKLATTGLKTEAPGLARKPRPNTTLPVFTDRDLMLGAIALAEKCRSERGRISPKVGAIVARDGIIIGEAYRGELAIGEHAEYTLLERKLPDESLAGATLFTTLEPCTTRNPPKIPCVERVIERRIARVVIGSLDPNEQIRGEGEMRLIEAGVRVARFDSDLIATVEKQNLRFWRQHRPGLKRKRTAAETIDPVESGRVGPNGHRIGFTKNGDKVEWIPFEEGEKSEQGRDAWPLILRRNDNDILAAYKEFWDKVWWNRNQVWIERLESSPKPLTEDQKRSLEGARKLSKKYGRKYGKKNLGWNDFEWGLLSGRMSALAWVMGAEWDESLDT